MRKNQKNSNTSYGACNSSDQKIDYSSLEKVRLSVNFANKIESDNFNRLSEKNKNDEKKSGIEDLRKYFNHLKNEHARLIGNLDSAIHSIEEKDHQEDVRELQKNSSKKGWILGSVSTVFNMAKEMVGFSQTGIALNQKELISLKAEVNAIFSRVFKEFYYFLIVNHGNAFNNRDAFLKEVSSRKDKKEKGDYKEGDVPDSYKRLAANVKEFIEGEFARKNKMSFSNIYKVFGSSKDKNPFLGIFFKTASLDLSLSSKENKEIYKAKILNEASIPLKKIKINEVIDEFKREIDGRSCDCLDLIELIKKGDKMCSDLNYRYDGSDEVELGKGRSMLTPFREEITRIHKLLEPLKTLRKQPNNHEPSFQNNSNKKMQI